MTYFIESIEFFEDRCCTDTILFDFVDFANFVSIDFLYERIRLGYNLMARQYCLGPNIDGNETRKSLLNDKSCWNNNDSNKG